MKWFRHRISIWYRRHHWWRHHTFTSHSRTCKSVSSADSQCHVTLLSNCRPGRWLVLAGAGWCGPALSSELSNFNRSVSLWRGDVLTHDTCPHQYPHHAADNSNIFPLTQIFSPLWHGNIFTAWCLICRLGAAAGCAARRREHGEYKMQ